MIAIFLFLNFMASFMGSIEAWGYSMQGFKVPNLKKFLLVPFRMFYSIGILFLCTYINIEWLDALGICISYMFTFSIFHNGPYEVTKAIIQKRYLNFWTHFTDLSKHDSSKLSYNFTNRLYLAIFGLLIFIAFYLSKIYSILR